MRLLPLLAFLLLACPLRAQETIDLPTALQKGWVQASMTGNPASAHYIKPLRLALTNVFDKILVLKLEAGHYFVSEPAEYQDIVNTAGLVVSLKPQEKKEMALYGVCTEAKNRAPDAQAQYKLGAAPKLAYATYAKFVEKENLFGTSEAQHGMWCISDDKPLEEIFGHTDNGAIGEKLRAFVGKLLDKPVPKLADIAQHYAVQVDGRQFTQYRTQNRKRAETSGKFYYELAKKTKVLIGMFDANNILIREIYANPADNAGKHTVVFAFDSMIYPDDVYVFKLITDDKMWIGMEMDKRKMRPVRKN
jgi:hypothetical protein